MTTADGIDPEYLGEPCPECFRTIPAADLRDHLATDHGIED